MMPIVMTPAENRVIELYADEIEVLRDAAKESGMKELTEAMETLFQYSERKSSLNRGPVKIKYE